MSSESGPGDLRTGTPSEPSSSDQFLYNLATCKACMVTIRLTSILAATLLAVTACTPSEPPPTSVSVADCVFTADDLVVQATEYVALFDDALIGDLAGSELEGASELDQIVSITRTQAIADGCDMEVFDAILGSGIDGLTGIGPVGRRVAMSLQGIDPGALPPKQILIGPDDDLVGILLELGSGSEVNLEAGEYLIDELILLDRTISLIGAGRDETFIRSSAAGAAVLIVGLGEYALSAMSMESRNLVPSGLLAGPAMAKHPLMYSL